ncbi:transforming growth factor-beta-induced protein ig-h3-like [Glandiceps talaboti]
MKSLLTLTLIATVIFFVGLVGAQPQEREYHLSRQYGYGGRRAWRHGPWWQGPNICVTRRGNFTSEFENLWQDSDDFFSSMPSFFGPGQYPRQRRHRRMILRRSWHSYCHDYEEHFRRCTHKLNNEGGLMTTEVTHQCCHGYGRERGDSGCPIKYDLQALDDTLISVGVTDYAALFDVTSVQRKLDDGNNYTIFAPINEAMTESQLDVVNTLVENDGGLDSLRTSIESHVVQGLLTTSDMRDEEILTSIAGTNIRMTYYPKSGPDLLVTANCARVVKQNQFATNGVIHTVDKMITSPTKTISEIIETDPRFTVLRTALSKAQFADELNKRTQLTLFAPTDGAFEKMDQELLKSITRDMGCLASLIENHLVPHTICAAAISGRHHVRSLLNTKLNINRTKDDKIFIKGAQVVAMDIIATNGVIHVIDEVIVPKQSLGLPDLLDGELRELVEDADLVYLLRNTRNATIFAPTDKAIENLPEDVAQSFKDSQVLRQVLLHHVVPETLTTRNLGNYINDEITALDGTTLRISSCSRSSFFTVVHRGQLLVECIPIVETKIDGCTVDVRGCNGIIHTVDKVIIPPSGNILEILKADISYSRLLETLEATGLAEELDKEGALTIFAPTNEAFEALSKDYLERVMEEPSTLRDILSYHISEGMVCGARLRSGNWWMPLFLNTMNGERIRIMDGMAGLVADQSPITETDTMATNGVIHKIEKVLFPY